MGRLVKNEAQSPKVYENHNFIDVGIPWELYKQLGFDYINKWYNSQPDIVLQESST